ncbi:MAG: 6,7-dimethyl-8-ribityllumazine synthase [Phycisphaerales bacterium]|jgi:6,7-dimethyl-8-ribityllumazine synthase|nr:6,7-dimethyl-8-ribityllumazine synthase [Phycisphaerales bacterium]
MPEYRQESADLDATNLRVAVVTSSYHGDVTGPLLSGATETFLQAGGLPDNLVCLTCPGAWELAVSVAAVREHVHPGVDAIVALGCVIRGETTHDRWINQAVCQSLAAFSVQHVIPVSLGLLTCDTAAQAAARAGGARGNKGAEAMAAAITQANLIRAMRTAVTP